MQRIVAAKLHDHRARVVRQRPVEPLQRGGRRVARHAGIDDLDLLPARLERRLELRRKGLVLRQAIACGKTVPQRHDDGLARLGACRLEAKRKKQGCGEKAHAGDVKFHLFDLFALLYCGYPVHILPNR